MEGPEDGYRQCECGIGHEKFRPLCVYSKQLLLAKFALNSSVSKSTGYVPFELVQGDMLRLSIATPSDAESMPGLKAFAEQARNNLLRAHDAILDSRIEQTHHACHDALARKRRAGEVIIDPFPNQWQ